MRQFIQKLFGRRDPEADRLLLLEVLRETRILLARPGNDFSWSSWKDADVALKEVDGLIKKVERGSLFGYSTVSCLFAPTGPIQEVSISSGWAEEFLSIAERFDHAWGKR